MQIGHLTSTRGRLALCPERQNIGRHMTSDTKNVSIINFCGMNDSSHTERKAEDQMAVYEGITYSRQSQ